MSFTLDSISSFPSKLKLCFASTPGRYSVFMDAVRKYASAEIDIQDLLRRISKLLMGHPSIIQEFNELLPCGMTLNSYMEALFSGAGQDQTIESCKENSRTANIEEDEAASFDSQDLVTDEPAQQSAILNSSVNCDVCLTKIGSNIDLHVNNCQSENLAEISKYGTLREFAFFSKVRRLMGNDETYLNFMRCLTLYTKDIVTGAELIDVLQPFTLKDPELSSELRRMLRCGSSHIECCASAKAIRLKSSESQMEIDYASCRKYGISYRALPSSFPQPLCTGRSLVGNEICNEQTDLSKSFLNNKHEEPPSPLCPITCKRGSDKHGIKNDFADQWKRAVFGRRPSKTPMLIDMKLLANMASHEIVVSLKVLNDTWVSFPLWSEDSTFGNSKISQYEEFLYRSEDERFELDVVIDNMASAVQLLEDASVKMNRMSPDDAKAFQLDICLGGSSEVLPRKSIERIYGDKVGDVMESLMHRPYVAVPIVLRRLRSRIEEFREAKKNYIKVWKEECEKNYAKWLQSQTTSFRQLDARLMRAKTLINEAEVAAEEGFGSRFCCRNRHQEFVFASKSDLQDATNLIIHYLNYLPTVQTDDSFRISQMLHDTLPQLISMSSQRVSAASNDSHNSADDSDDQYAVMFTNSSWYIFLRLFHLFCKRLEEIRLQCERLQRNAITVELVMRNGTKASSCYDFVLSLMRLMIEGAIDVFIYETDMQKVLGANAYMTFSVEKILHNIVKQLQNLVSDELNQRLMKIFNEERGRGAAGGSVSTAYRRQLAEFSYRCRVLPLISDDCCFKIVFFKYKGKVTMELIDPEADSSNEEQLTNHLRTISYIEQYLSEDDFACYQFADVKSVCLARNLKQRSRSKSSAGEQRQLRSIDKTRCLFAGNSFKLTFVSGSWSFMYREKSFTVARKTARPLTEFKRKKFHRWWTNWKSLNVSAEQERRVRDVLLRPVHHMRTTKSRYRDRHLPNATLGK